MEDIIQFIMRAIRVLEGEDKEGKKDVFEEIILQYKFSKLVDDSVLLTNARSSSTPSK